MKRLLIIGAAAVAVAVPALSRAAAAPTNLALGAVATASSVESAQYPASNAIDGDPATRWSSAFSDPQTLTVDLGARASISDISLLWEAAYGKAYTLAVSNDGSAWTQVAATDDSDGGTDDYPGLSATGRYVRLTGTARALPYGYSLFEIAVNGEFTETAVAPAASSYSMPEKDGTVTVPVRLNRASDSAVTVKYATADGSATGGKDYEAASGTLTFAPGETEKTITLHSIDDGLDEPNETFDLNFSDASVTLGPRAKSTVTITDDDEAMFDGATFTVAGYEGTLDVLTAPQPPNSSGLFTFSNNAANKPTLTASPDPRPGSPGTQALSVAANITGDGAYGGFSHNLPASQDWSAYDGFSFWFKGTATGHNLEFEIKDGGPDGEHSELWNSHVLDDSTAWKFVHLPFSAFTKRTDYQPGGAPSDGKLDLTEMWGWAMNLTPGENAFLVDDVQVYEQVRNVETFEGPAPLDQRGMYTFSGGNPPPALAIEAIARDGVTDNHALKVDYDTPAGLYGGYGQDLADAQDWSSFKGLRFWFYGRRTSASPATINIEIKDGGTGPGASELWTTSFLDDTQGWKLVTIPFSKFKYRTDYQPVGGIDHVLNLTKMWGYAVTPPAGDHGSFDFDDVQTYGVNSGVPDISFATDKPVYLAEQGDTVTVGVTVTTVDGKPLADDQQVAYSTADDTAVAGTDYTPASGTLTFAAGTDSGTTKTFPVTLLSVSGASEARRLKVTLGGSDTPALIVIAAHGLPYLDSSLPVEARVDDLFGRMTTAEKIGQMTQAERLALDAPSDIATYHLGSILSGGGSTPAPNTPAGWQDMISGFQTQAMTTRLQIPLIYGADVVHGHNNVTGATLFPHNIGIGAAHDPSLGVDEGAVSAAEMKATGVPWAFAPCLCVSRDERWGRAYESFGEDPALVIQNEDVIDGLQDHGALATAKHFAGDGGTTFGSGSGSYTIDQGVTPLADMATLHLPPFVAAVKDHHVGSVMPSYSSVAYPSGNLKMHANRALLTDWLKVEQGFDGFVITDWQAIDQLPGNYDSDVVTSINAGIDMVMTPYEYQAFEASLTNAVSSGAVPMARVDDAVKRILREKFRLGLFEHPFPDAGARSDFGTAAHRGLSRKAAAESQVLLKNDGVLPLSKSGRIYVAGSNADDAGNQSGGWTISWQGGSGAVQGATTILAGMRSVAPGASITYSRDASAPLSGYDAGVVVVGETPYAEGVGDVGNGHTLALSAADRAAIDRVCGAMKCAVLVVSGRPMYDARLRSGDALVASWLPGTEGAGVADTLFGDVPFTGRLPVTWARSEAQLPINVGDAVYDPQFPYGWGLRTDVDARARLVRARSLGATGLDAVLAADVWNADGSVKHGAAVLALLRGVPHSSFVADDLVASVARDLAQAAPIDAASSKLTSDAEHLLYVGDLQGAIAKLSQVALTSVSVSGGVGGTVPATLSLTLGPAASFGPLTAGVAKDYTAQTTANVTSTAGDAALSASGPVHLANGAFTLPSPLEVSFSKANWTGPVSNDAVTVRFGQHIGAGDALRTGTYSATVTFTLSTTTP